MTNSQIPQLTNTDKAVLEHYNQYHTAPAPDPTKGLLEMNIDRSIAKLMDCGHLGPASKNKKAITNQGIAALKKARQDDQE